MAYKKSPADFHFGSRIGEGSYSTVFKAIDSSTRKVYAIKVLSKKHIVKENKIKYVNIEKITLNRLGRHPGIVTLHYTFQDEQSLYFVIDFAEYGELLTMIRKMGSLSENNSRYYMYQLIDAVEFMHSRGVIHRDLKPENILVNSDRKIMITDFGAAKVLNLGEDGQVVQDEESFQKGSFVGTAEYVSPELLKYNKCGFEADVWAIGCILYQFIVGVPPFKGKTEYLTFEKIVNLQYNWPSFFVPELIKDLVSNLLRLNPEERLTIPQMQKHNWFARFDWTDKNKIWAMNPPPLEPYRPLIEQQLSSSAMANNFQKIYISKPKKNTKRDLMNSTISQIRNDGVILPSSGKPVKREIIPNPTSQSPVVKQVLKVPPTNGDGPQRKPMPPVITNQISKVTSQQQSRQQQNGPERPQLPKLQEPPSPQNKPPPKKQLPLPLTQPPAPSVENRSQSSSPVSTSPLKTKELLSTITSKLAANEKIEKLDYINLSELKYKSDDVGLTDVSINQIILDNETTLRDKKDLILLTLTDHGNLYFFKIDKAVDAESYQFYLKINLTNKFFAMYDYEFDEDFLRPSGFLILEILKMNQLVFLSPLRPSQRSVLQKDDSVIINHDKKWIESLFTVKELLRSNKPTNSSPTTASTNKITNTGASVTVNSSSANSSTLKTTKTTTAKPRTKALPTAQTTSKPPNIKPPAKPASRPPSVATTPTSAGSRSKPSSPIIPKDRQMPPTSAASNTSSTLTGNPALSPQTTSTNGKKMVRQVSGTAISGLSNNGGANTTSAGLKPRTLNEKKQQAKKFAGGAAAAAFIKANNR